ncbi:serine--tRNA ligase [Candidatus Dojkabacteria bacterium]|jgi:seryl-tRNA synthetase|nr:serine--tRNA ligase [Candidatus Dojkabacteria bacterium]
MIDIKQIIENKEKVKNSLTKRMKEEDMNLDLIIETYNEWKMKLTDFEKERARQKGFNDQMAKAKKGSDEFKKNLEQLKAIAEDVKKLEISTTELEQKLTALVEVLPNIPDDDVVAGEKESNKILKTVGKKPEFDFKVKDHLDVAANLNMIDMERGAKLAGASFALYTGLGAQLEWALINYFITQHLADGYKMILPPHLLTEKSGYTAGQFPKFKEDVYWCQDGNFLLPTSETAMANLYRDEVIPEEKLPMKLFSYTPCYRREAGGYRAQERGLIRMHQFNKVEMFQYTLPEYSPVALEELVAKACRLVEGLGLHYNIVQLAAGDCSAGAAKTIDIEVYLPYLERYQEVSSISNVRDYQARRGNIKYKPTDGSKPQYVHMLNASGLATSRLMVAILETYQNADGSLTVPKVLRPFIGIDKITK